MGIKMDIGRPEKKLVEVTGTGTYRTREKRSSGPG
jgi:hypothetical protein